MGILPLEYAGGADRTTYGLTGEEIFDIAGIAGDLQHRSNVTVTATDPQTRKSVSFQARVRIDTPDEAEYYRNGGILQYVLRQLRGREQTTSA
jgi:aconitate hydratase